MSAYNKRPFSISEQIEKFEREGILLNERDGAEKLLFNVNYFRLRTYAEPFRDDGSDGKSLSFRDGISFGDIVDLYMFDQDLRMLLFKAITSIEVSLRTRMTQIYSENTGGGHWFLDRNMYHCAHHNRIWNRRFTMYMDIPYNTLRPFMDRSGARGIRVNKLFPLLCAMKFLLDSIDETNDLKTSLMKLLNRPVRLLSFRNMGFPDNWQMMPVWQ